MGLRQTVIGAGFAVIGATRLHRIAAPYTRGLGAILMFHHVRPETHGRDFAPNRLLEVTPDFLDATIRHLGRSGFDVLSLDEALDRVRSNRPGARPFAVLTFDDGHRDNRDFALPVLQRHGVPGTFYITTGFAERTARLWWVELEEVVRRADRIRVAVAGHDVDLPAGDSREKRAAFESLYWTLRRGPGQVLLDTIGALCAAHGVDGRALVEAQCMDWAEIERFAEHPLVTIGAHTLTHPMLARQPEDVARRELADAKAIIERRLGRPVRHLAYPVGDPTSAGAREFALARECGYASAVTTRPGVVFPEHADHPMVLPRLSVNGNHQSVAHLDILLSGAAFALWNRGRRLNIA